LKRALLKTDDLYPGDPFLLVYLQIYIFDKTYIITYEKFVMNQLLPTVTDSEKQSKIQAVALGLGYVAVELEGSHVGLSANIADTSKARCSVFTRAGTLRGMSAAEALDLGKNGDLLSRSIALATLNALKNTSLSGNSGDVFEHITIVKSDRIAMVGFIEPVANMLKDIAAEVHVFEDRPLNSNFIRPAKDMAITFARSDIIILTATTIINNTLDDILALPNSAREVVLMGPSTPMISEVFISTPVTHLAGSAIIDGEKAFQIVMEGGGTRALYHYSAMKKIHQEVHP
jgi:uncharacterized protein (DUF4213/DUF364 family)